MSQAQEHAFPIRTAAKEFGVDKRTIERKLKSGAIAESQTYMKD
jgi:hypothetical protein